VRWRKTVAAPTVSGSGSAWLLTTTVPGMGVVEAAIWGLAGGAAASLVGLSAAVVAAGFRWPWHDNDAGMWPHVFVASVGLLVGALVSAAAHAQMTGAWPALVMGASAPSVIRGVLSRVEVTERKPETGDGSGPG
jgi:hypothetical protein